MSFGLAFKGFRDFAFMVPEGPEDYRRWNPETGLLPVLDFDGARVPDSSGILDWLDEQFPDPPFLARDPRTARQQRQLESWIGETFYFYWVRWMRERVLAEEAAERAAHEAGGELARLGILNRVSELLIDVPEKPGERGPEFARRLDDLVGFLGARPFLYADEPGRADLTAAAFLSSLERNSIPGGERMLEMRPALRALLARVRAHIGN